MHYDDSHMLNVYRDLNCPPITVIGDAPSPQALANEKMEDRACLTVYIHRLRMECDLLLSPQSEFEVLGDGSLVFEASRFWIFYPDNQKRGQKYSFGVGWLKFSYTKPLRPNGWAHLVGIYSDKGYELYMS